MTWTMFSLLCRFEVLRLASTIASCPKSIFYRLVLPLTPRLLVVTKVCYDRQIIQRFPKAELNFDCFICFLPH